MNIDDVIKKFPDVIYDKNNNEIITCYIERKLNVLNSNNILKPNNNSVCYVIFKISKNKILLSDIGYANVSRISRKRTKFEFEKNNILKYLRKIKCENILSYIEKTIKTVSEDSDFNFKLLLNEFEIMNVLK